MGILPSYLLAYGVLNSFTVEEDGYFRAPPLYGSPAFTFFGIDAFVQIGGFFVYGALSLVAGFGVFFLIRTSINSRQRGDFFRRHDII